MAASNQNTCSSTIRRWSEHLVTAVVALVQSRSPTPLPALVVATTHRSSSVHDCSSHHGRLQLPARRVAAPGEAGCTCSRPPGEAPRRASLLRPPPTYGPSHGGIAVGEEEGEGQRPLQDKMRRPGQRELERGAGDGGMPLWWWARRRNSDTGRRAQEPGPHLR